MQIITNTVNFVRGTIAAYRDDGQIGSNDAPGLVVLAKKTKIPFLDTLVRTLEKPLKPATPKFETAVNYATEVIDATPKIGSTFNDPARALGAPEGAGLTSGSLHVYEAQSLTVALLQPAEEYVVVFENAFHRQNADGSLSAEVATTDRGYVEVSSDGVTFYRLLGEVGKNAVLTNSLNRLAPWLTTAGGDRFYFRDNDNLPPGFKARYVRVIATEGGIDVDAVFGA